MSEDLKTVNSPYAEIVGNTGAAELSQSDYHSETNSAREELLKLVRDAVSAAEDRKGADIVVLRVSEVSYLADYFVFITGFSRVQVRAIAQGIQENVEKELHRLPRRTEGEAEGSWVVLDYGDAMIHILMPREREFYNLEAFWGHAERIELTASNPVGKRET